MNQFEPSVLDVEEAWPPLPLEQWRDTYATLHMWTQIVGKVRMALSPPVNHFWHVPLSVSSRGLTTGPIPCGPRVFEMAFDFIHHNLEVHVSDDRSKVIPLLPRTVAGFYRELMAALQALGIAVRIRPVPDEVADPIPFAEDRTHASYDPQSVGRLWRILLTVDTLLKAFRGRFSGKASAVNFYWGSFDLAVSFFSGRRAPPRDGADSIMREAYSHEVASFGWWPGGGAADGPAFYSYTVPAPPGYERWPIRPASAFYSRDFAEFLLPYDAVRTAP
ncbi:MAG: DUF5996 family protein, partial [Myxococcales bacterium]